MRTQQICLLLCTTLFMSAAKSESVTLSIGKQTIPAEIAATRQSREQGLMQRKQLCEDCGMLFVFERAGRYGFWMKDTDLSLAIAFIDAGGRILNIAEMQADTTNAYYPEGNALYALEMNEGWFARHRIKPKDKVDGLQLAPLGQ